MHFPQMFNSNVFHIVFTLLLVGCGTRSIDQSNINPPIPLALLESTTIPPSPGAAPEQWLMAHIDVETTGLLPDYHEMIDIGLVMTDLKGKIIDSLFLRIQPNNPERTSPIAREINAFDPDKWKTLGALHISEAVDSILGFHERVAANRPTLMVSFNSHFDAAFLDHLFREANHSWREMYHYFILDIPSMAWSLGYQDLTLRGFKDSFNIKDEPHVAELHTGISGAMLNVRLYQAIVNEGEK